MQKALNEKQERLLALFKVAIERERESQRLYEDMAGHCEEPALRQVIETLKDSERIHEELLLERYKFLREDPPFSS